MDAAPIARPLLGLRGRLLKTAVVVPDLLISGLLWLMGVALLPTEVAVPGFKSEVHQRVWLGSSIGG